MMAGFDVDQLRSCLRELNYNENFSADSAELINHLLHDLYNVTAQYLELKDGAGHSKSEHC